jgi:hypothetical protein
MRASTTCKAHISPGPALWMLDEDGDRQGVESAAAACFLASWSAECKVPIDAGCCGLWAQGLHWLPQRRDKGPPQKKSVTPVVGGRVRGQKRSRVRFLCSIFFVVFLNSPHRETPKNAIKENREQVGFGVLVDFFVNCKSFSTRPFLNTFFVVLLNFHR